MPLIRKDIENIPNAETAVELAHALTAPDSDGRWKAARSLARVPSSAGQLGEALKVETDPRVREALFTSLAYIQTQEAVEAVLPHLRSDNASIRTAALDALNAMPAAASLYIPKLLADADPDIRILVCDTARRLPSELASRYLCELLNTETNANVCGAAVDALSEVGEPEALSVMAKCAERFSNEPFLLFSIKIASERIGGDARAPRAP
jgi:HEAT repeat protein